MEKKIVGGLIVVVGLVAGILLSKNNPAPEQATIPAPAPESSAGAGTSQTDTTPSADSSPTTKKVFTVIGTDYSFTPAKISVKKGDRVKIIFKNENGFHDLSIDGYKIETKRIRTGGEDSIEFVADKAGAFEYYCDVGSHRDLGMHGTLIVE